MTVVGRSLRAVLAEAAQAGTLLRGSKVATRRARVEQLSRPGSAVRRSLDGLERDGLGVREVGRGTFLTEAALARPEPAPAETSPAEIMQVRLLVEPPVAALAARVA